MGTGNETRLAFADTFCSGGCPLPQHFAFIYTALPRVCGNAAAGVAVSQSSPRLSPCRRGAAPEAEHGA